MLPADGDGSRLLEEEAGGVGDSWILSGSSGVPMSGPRDEHASFTPPKPFSLWVRREFWCRWPSGAVARTFCSPLEN